MTYKLIMRGPLNRGHLKPPMRNGDVSCDRWTVTAATVTGGLVIVRTSMLIKS